ncbi:MAG: anaerobic ribonucleoside-triphosphate reductase activating protein, partial [Candidatus Hadarchaeales archaeon]
LDYPGKIAAIAFVGGCNFRCGFCYNRDLVLAPDAISSISESEVLSYLESKRDWLDGLVITGGEPTLYSDLPDFLARVKSLGYSVKLDTNGSNPDMLAALIERHLVDYVALDIKAPLDDEKYHEIVGSQSNGVTGNVRRSVEILMSGNVDYEFRTTVIPELGREDLLRIAEQIRGARRYYLQQFVSNGSHLDARYSSEKPHPMEFLISVKSEIGGHFGTCGVRGVRQR